MDHSPYVIGPAADPSDRERHPAVLAAHLARTARRFGREARGLRRDLADLRAALVAARRRRRQPSSSTSIMRRQQGELLDLRDGIREVERDLRAAVTARASLLRWCSELAAAAKGMNVGMMDGMNRGMTELIAPGQQVRA